jgi:hypothetical protein
MNPQRETLSEALREMAAASPEASPELGARLSGAFARHHAQRRLIQRGAVVVALAACVAISVYWLRPRGQVAKIKVVEPTSQTAQIPDVSARPKDANVGHASPEPKIVAPENPERTQTPAIAKAAVQPRTRTTQVNKHRNHSVEPPPATAETGDFVALSTFDPAVPLGESRMVRMDLPGSALQLIGYPVDGQLLDRRIVTDVLVGQDGMPYAVRLVQTRNIH